MRTHRGWRPGGAGLVLAALGCGVAAPVPMGGTEDDSGGSSSAATTGLDDSVDSSTGEPSDGGSGESGPGPETDGDGEVLEGSCPEVVLPPRPADPAERGPFTVGVRTIDIEGLAVEVWYPAADADDRGEPVVYDVRDWLPPSEQVKISDEDNPWQRCDCYRDLPLAEDYGPYPVILFVHGMAGFRAQSLPHMVHWASRGFVVMATDHPGLRLADMLGIACGDGNVPQDIPGDLATLVAAVRGETAGLEDFGDRLDAGRIATTGHSAGGHAVASTGEHAQVIIPMAAGGVMDGPSLESSLVLGAMADSVVPFTSQSDGYDTSPARKRLVGIGNTGHLAFSQMCSLRNDAGEDLIQIAQASGICGADFATALFQCDASFLPDPEAWDIIHFASSAVLEETLHCEPEAAADLGRIEDLYPAVAVFREVL